MKITDGTGTGYEAKVNTRNELLTLAIVVTEETDAALNGRAYNISTDSVSITGATGMLYIKNNESEDVCVSTLRVALGSGSFAGEATVDVIRNPTTGTLISNAADVPINVNENFSSSKTLLDSLAYAGVDGYTITNGTDALVEFMGGDETLTINNPIVLPKGSALGVRVTPNLSSGSVNCIVSARVFLHDAAITNGKG